MQICIAARSYSSIPFSWAAPQNCRQSINRTEGSRRMTTTQPRVALVLGATGGIGSEVARQLRDAGWQVRASKRGVGGEEERGDGLAWFGGAAMSREDVLRAAGGCAVIVHAVTPPGY